MEEADWEYNAPRYIDFDANEHLCENVDDYFAVPHQIDKENVDEKFKSPDPQVEDPFFQTPSRETYGVKTPSRVMRSCFKTNSKQIDLTDVAREDEALSEMQPVATDKLESNAVSSSLCDALPQTPKQESTVITPPSRVLRSKSVSAESDSKHKENKPVILSNIVTPSRLASWKNSKVTFNAGKKFSSDSKKKLSFRKTINQISKPEAALGPPMKKMKKDTPIQKTTALTKGIPHSHKPHKRHLTSDEIELKDVKKLRSFPENSKKANKLLIKKFDHSTPSKIGKPVTKTKEFHFRTDERAAKVHNMSTRSDVCEKSDFQRGLRKYAPSPVKKSGTTVIKPFNLSKRKHPDEHPKTGNFVPMAKAIMDFQSRTPSRFRRSNNRLDTKPFKPMRATVPKTPNITKKKSRPASIMSAQEKEDLEVEEMKRHQFKANPVKTKLLSEPDQIKKVEKKPITIPVEFHLSANPQNHAALQEVEKPKPFTAQPVPEFVFDKPVVRKKRSTDVTVPMSPAFALKSRLRPRKSEVEKKPEGQAPVFYHPPPNPSHVFRPKLRSTSTNPQPFSFHSRDQDRLARKQEKVKEILEKETASSSFKAQPIRLPPSPTSALPPKQVKEPTKVEPFKLKSDERAAVRVEEWEKQLQSEVKQMREKATFTANQNYEKIVKGKPWEPKLDRKPPTEPANVMLRSELRAKEREEFEKRLEEEMSEKERVLEEEKKRQEELDKKKIEELRRNQVHQAQEVHRFKSVTVAKSSKQLTMPQSPKFSTRFNK